MTVQQHQVVEPGQLWQGTHRAHCWTVKVLGLSLNAVEFESIAKGARVRSRVRGSHQHQRMNRAKFVAKFCLVRDVV